MASRLRQDGAITKPSSISRKTPSAKAFNKVPIDSLLAENVNAVKASSQSQRPLGEEHDPSAKMKANSEFIKALDRTHCVREGEEAVYIVLIEEHLEYHDGGASLLGPFTQFEDANAAAYGCLDEQRGDLDEYLETWREEGTLHITAIGCGDEGERYYVSVERQILKRRAPKGLGVRVLREQEAEVLSASIPSDDTRAPLEALK